MENKEDRELRKELDEIERILDSFIAEGNEYMWNWIRERFREYYSIYIENKEDVERITSDTMLELGRILRHLETRKGKETADTFYERLLTLLMYYYRRRQHHSPVSLSFLVVFQMSKDSL